MKMTRYGARLTAAEGVCKDKDRNLGWRRHLYRGAKCRRCGHGIKKVGRRG